MVPGTSERLSQKGHLSAKRTYELWEARATFSSYPSLWPGLPRPPGAVTLQRLSGLSPDTPCAVSAYTFSAGTFLHPLTLLTFVPTVKRVGKWQSGLTWGQAPPPPPPRLHALLTAVNSGSPSSHPGCPLTSSVVGQRIILQMLQLVKKTIPNKPQEDVRNGDIFQGKPFSSFLYLPKDDLVA